MYLLVEAVKKYFVNKFIKLIKIFYFVIIIILLLFIKL